MMTDSLRSSQVVVLTNEDHERFLGTVACNGPDDAEQMADGPMSEAIEEIGADFWPEAKRGL